MAIKTSPLLWLGPGCGSHVPRDSACLPTSSQPCSSAALLYSPCYLWLFQGWWAGWIAPAAFLWETPLGCWSLFTHGCRDLGVPGNLGVYIVPLCQRANAWMEWDNESLAPLLQNGQTPRYNLYSRAPCGVSLRLGLCWKSHPPLASPSLLCFP